MSIQSPEITRPPVARDRWVVLIVGTLGIFAALGLARFGYSMVIDAMKGDLHITRTQAGLMQSANLTGYLLMAAVGGALASRVGARLVAGLGLLVCALAMLYTGFADGFIAACLWRAVTGLGSGAANVAIMGLWPAWFPPAQRGRAAGVAVSGSSVALIATGLIVPPLLAQLPPSGWRNCWMLYSAVAIVVAVLACLLLRDAPNASAPVETSKHAWTALYRAPAVWHLGLVYVAFGFSYMIYLTFFKLYLTSELHFSGAWAGNLFMLMGACSLLCGVLWGAASDRVGRRAALIGVFLVHTAAFALFALADPRALIASAVLFGLSAWSIPAIMAAACGDLLGARLTAAGLGFITLFFSLGQAAAPTVAGAIADTGRHSFAPAFLLAAGVALLGAVGSALLPKRQ